ncbi:hypothetical protein ACFE04_003299 [Oxalis oulophora]
MSLSLTSFSLLLILFLLSQSPYIISASSIQSLLQSQGLPGGIFPENVKSYNLEADGRLEVHLDGPCLAKFDTRVFFDSVVRANLSYGGLVGLEGLTQEELFLWFPVKGIIVNDPNSGLILFDIGLAHKQLSLSLFEDPPACKSQDDDTAVAMKEVLNVEIQNVGAVMEKAGRIRTVVEKTGRKNLGFRAQR